jgi:DNA-binding NarL/FixJ family response regulator
MVPAPKVKPPRHVRRISVLLVDPHPLLSEGLKCILERQPDIRVVTFLPDTNAALREAQRLRPDVVVLTPTERNILRLVTEGRSNFEVAATIGLSPRTVETYRSRLMRKLGIENLPSLVRYAIRHGITPLD